MARICLPRRSTSLAACADKATQRLRRRAVRDLSQAMVQLKIPGNAATRYADILAERGVSMPEQLATLSQPLLNACEMRSEHRQLLRASAALAAAESTAFDETPTITNVSPSVGTSAAAEVDVDADDADDKQEGEGHTLLVGAELDGARIDAALAALLPPLSRSYFSTLCTEGRVRVDGVPVTKKSAKVVAGATIDVTLRAARELSVVPEPIALESVYEDEHMVAVNKAAGMVVHPAPGHWNGTFANALAHLISEQQSRQSAVAAAAAAPEASGEVAALPDAFGDGLRPGIVHRLDRFTTGVLLGAKTLDAQRGLLESFASRQVRKVYLAILVGMPQPGAVVTARIGRHPTERVKMAVVHEEARGRSAHTVVHTLASDGRLSLVAVRIRTGRTHQIRVHTAHLRCPVLGDPLYGDTSRNRLEARRASRPLLHAFELGVAHPVTGLPLTLRAPPPDDLRAIGAELAGCGADAATFEAWLSQHLAAALAADDDGVQPGA